MSSVGVNPHPGPAPDGFGPRAFIAGGHQHPGVVLAKGAGPGMYNRWRTACAGYSVLWGRVHQDYVHHRADAFDRAVDMAKQRAQILALAGEPRHAAQRRRLLLQARRVERIIVSIGEAVSPGVAPSARAPALAAIFAANGYTDLIHRNGVLCGLHRYAFTTGLVVGLHECGHERRYCYEHAADARAALIAWDGTGHPAGPWIKCKGAGIDLLNPALTIPDAGAGARQKS